MSTGGGDTSVFNPYQAYLGGNPYQGPGAFSTNQGVGQSGNASPLGFGYSDYGGSYQGGQFVPGQQSIDPIYGTQAFSNFQAQNNPPLVSNALALGEQNLQQSANQFLPLIKQYLGQGQQGVNQATQQTLPQLGNIYGQGLRTQQGLTDQSVGQAGSLSSGMQGQIAGLENQNLGQVQGLLDNYNKNFMEQLGPQGQLGQQMMGEFNNYGITPQSGAFQSALGNQLGSLGAQNALTLGREALQPGINAQYNTLGQGLQGQLGLLGQGLGGQMSTAQQGTQQAGGLTNAGALTSQQLGSQMGTAPLSLLGNTLGQQQSLINESTQLPIQNLMNQMGFQGAQQLGNQNVQAQNNGAQMGLLGNLGGGALSGLGAAYGK